LLTRLIGLKDHPGFVALYHKSAQAVAVTMLPATVVLCLFADRLLFVWAGSSPIVDNASTIVAILAVGTCLNGFMNIPYYAQLAAGWTSLAFWQNLVSVVVLVPLLIVLTLAYGPVGAALAWVILNSGYVLIAINIMHRRILVGEKRDWYLYDVALPIVTALAIALPLKALMPDGLSRVETAAYLCTVGCLTLVAGALAAPRIHPLVTERLRSVRRRCDAWGW
jgi:O-antigen/teichoic acid export membrane protein